MAVKATESRLTQKGQVTIPAEIRARLGLKPRDRVRFEVEGMWSCSDPRARLFWRGTGR